jgi:putative ABC transport system ATP-binding protein
MMLQVNNIVKSFSSLTQPVLNGISLELAVGDFCVIVGSNGSGKSTLMKTLSGEHVVDSGKITLQNKDITHHPIHRRARLISSVSQDVAKGTIQEMTLLENLCLSHLRGLKAHFRSFQHHAKSLKEKIASLDLGLEQYLHQPMSALSGGQRQMIATVMACLSSPKLLLLDEHICALDPKTQTKIMAFTADMIAKYHMTTLMITHQLSDAIHYGNRLIMLNKGNIVLDLNQEQKKAMTVPRLLDLFHATQGEVS